MRIIFDTCPESWGIKRLGDICEKSGGNIQTGPFGSQLHAEDYVDGGIPSIMPQNLGDNQIILDDIARITSEDAIRLKKYLVREGDIVYSRRGDITRRVLMRSEHDGWLCGTGCLRVRFGSEALDKEFAFYYLGHPLVRHWIALHAVGATMPNLNTEILSDLPFLVPPLREQKAIAAVLSCLDRKIENLRKQNETLEAIAQTLFKRWFIDFEFPYDFTQGKPSPDGQPYKSSGGAMQPSELGDIPEGWRVAKLGEVFDLSYGKSLIAEKRVHGDYPVVGSSGIVDYHKSALVKAPGIVIGRKGTIGKVIWLEKDFYPIDTTFYVVDKIGCESLHFYYFLLRIQNFTRLMSDSAVPGLNRDAAYESEFALSDKALIDQFNRIIKSIFLKKEKNSTQIKKLTKTRDTLLPKLMSGQLRITP